MPAANARWCRVEYRIYVQKRPFFFNLFLHIFGVGTHLNQPKQVRVVRTALKCASFFPEAHKWHLKIIQMRESIRRIRCKFIRLFLASYLSGNFYRFERALETTTTTTTALASTTKANKRQQYGERWAKGKTKIHMYNRSGTNIYYVNDLSMRLCLCHWFVGQRQTEYGSLALFSLLLFVVWLEFGVEFSNGFRFEIRILASLSS